MPILIALVLLLSQASSDQLIASALAEGASSRQIQGYRVGRRATLIRSAVAVEIGRAYTPFLRVALAARQARETYRTFSAANLTPELTEPVVVVVFQPQPSSNGPTSVMTVLAMPKGKSDPTLAIQPIWSKPNDISYQNVFGATWTSSGMLAAFPLETMGAGFEFIAVYEGRAAMGSGPNGREIRGENLQRDWK